MTRQRNGGIEVEGADGPTTRRRYRGTVRVVTEADENDETHERDWFSEFEYLEKKVVNLFL